MPPSHLQYKAKGNLWKNTLNKWEMFPEVYFLFWLRKHLLQQLDSYIEANTPEKCGIDLPRLILLSVSKYLSSIPKFVESSPIINSCRTGEDRSSYVWVNICSEILGLIFEAEHRLVGWDPNCPAIHSRFSGNQSQTDTSLNTASTIFSNMALNVLVSPPPP